MRRLAVAAVLLVIALPIASRVAQMQARPVFPGSSERGLSPDPNAVRPIAAHDTVFIDEMTWLEVRDAIHQQHKTTALIAIGGVEQSGPYLVVGKHSYVIHATTDAIARKLGDALVAPVVSFVPEGNIDPPSGFMRYAGAISIRPETFTMLLTDVASSLRTEGFEHVIIVSDHGGNTSLIQGVVQQLSVKWANSRTTIHYVPAYYDYPDLATWLETQGIHQVDEGVHDDLSISSIMMTVSPEATRMTERLAAGKFSINGVSLAPVSKTVALGRRIIDRRAVVTVDAIHEAIRVSNK